jgi:rubrerythrin
MGEDWESWLRRFLMKAAIQQWCEEVKISTLCHYMPQPIQGFMSHLDESAFTDFKTLTGALKDLFAPHEKSLEEYEAEFLAIKMKEKEAFGSYYVRLLEAAYLAEEKRPEKIRKMFIKGIRPLKLMSEIAAEVKKMKWETVEEVYQYALEKEKEEAMLRKLAEIDREEKRENAKALKALQSSIVSSSTRSCATCGKTLTDSMNYKYCAECNAAYKSRNNNNTNNTYSNSNGNNSRNNNNNGNTNRRNSFSRVADDPFKMSAKQLTEKQLCLYCTKPFTKTHDKETCKPKYPYYLPFEVRALIGDGKPVPRRGEFSAEAKKIIEERAKNHKNKSNNGSQNTKAANSKNC